MGSFGLSEGNITEGKNIPQIMHPIITPSREVAQTLVSATSEWDLNREARAAC